MGRSRHIVAVALAIAMLGGISAAADAEAISRDEYVTALERICKPRAKATQRAMNGVRSDVHADRINVAAHKFGRAAKIFGGTVKTISRTPRPPSDLARLGKWFKYLGRQESYLRRIAAQLRAGHTIKAQRLTARFIHTGNLANNVVLPFGFDYCSFRFSRFG